MEEFPGSVSRDVKMRRDHWFRKGYTADAQFAKEKNWGATIGWKLGQRTGPEAQFAQQTVFLLGLQSFQLLLGTRQNEILL